MKYLALLMFTVLLAACPNKPAEYGDALTACVNNATTAEAFTACCVDAAHRFGRDPSFCELPPAADAGVE